MMEYYHQTINVTKEIRDYDSLTKKEIQAILKEEHHTEVTLRPRKSTLIALLKELEESAPIEFKQPITSSNTFLIILGAIVLVTLAATLAVV